MKDIIIWFQVSKRLKMTSLPPEQTYEKRFISVMHHPWKAPIKKAVKWTIYGAR
jgi:hypothetical protein